MSQYNSLKATIDANIKQNGVQAITGQILNSVLNQMVNTLGAGYQFAGVATTATDPGTPDAKVFYIANGKGTYANFGGLQVAEDEVVALYWDSAWHKVSTGIASQEKLSDLETEVNAINGTIIEEYKTPLDAFVSIDFTSKPFDLREGEETSINLVASTSDELYCYLKDSQGEMIYYLGTITPQNPNISFRYAPSTDANNAYVQVTGSGTNVNIHLEVSGLDQGLTKIERKVGGLMGVVKNHEHSISSYNRSKRIIAQDIHFDHDFMSIQIPVEISTCGKLHVKVELIEPYTNGASGMTMEIAFHLSDGTSLYSPHYLQPGEKEIDFTQDFRYAPYSGTYLELSGGSVGGIRGRVTIEPVKPHIVFFGDSITQIKDAAGKRYADYIKDYLDVNISNASVEGSGYAQAFQGISFDVTQIASLDGDLEIYGLYPSPYPFSVNILASDTKEDIARKIAEKYESIAPSLRAKSFGNTVTCVPYWGAFTEWINPDDVRCENGIGVTISVHHIPNNMLDHMVDKDGSMTAFTTNLGIGAMVEGLVSGDWTLQRAAADFLGLEQVVSTIDGMEDIDINDVDVVILAGGTNDYTGNMGNITDENTTLCGVMNRVIRRLMTANPLLRIIVATPIVRYFGDNLYAWDDSLWCDNYEYNGEIVMPILVDTIAKCAERNHVKVFDMYSTIGWNKSNFMEFFPYNDGTHPRKGLWWMGREYASMLNRTLW